MSSKTSNSQVRDQGQNLCVHSVRPRFPVARRGNISMMYLIVCVVCSVIAVYLLNIGHLTHQKMEMQNAADAAAITTSTWLSRGVNAVTATNHVIGEMTAMVAVHHALGGYPLDEGRVVVGTKRAEARDKADQELDAMYNAASSAGARTPAYETVRQREGIKAGFTLLEAKTILKEKLAEAYFYKAIAKAMQQSSLPPVVAAGIALEAAMDAWEAKILQEYLFLKAMHRIALGLLPMKQLLRDQMIPAARDYNDLVVERFPKVARKAGEMVGESLGTEITFYPEIALPVEKDPHQFAMRPLSRPKVHPKSEPPPNPSVRANSMREQIAKTSQLARATFPWVAYHREPVIHFIGSMTPICGAGEIYKDWTDGATKRLVNEFQRNHLDLGLYVLKGATPPDKGYELWTEDRELLDQIFSVQAYAWRDQPAVIGKGAFFTQQHAEGRVAVAQSLVYNANEQKRHRHYTPLRYKRILPERQADVGWDTLNWRPGLRPYELVAKTRRGPVRSIYPEIQLNWQTKLVPVSPKLVERAKRHLPAPVGPIIKRVDTSQVRLFTH